MPKASPRASAQKVPTYIPVFRRSYKPRPDGHDPFFDLPFVSHSKRDGYVSAMNAWDVPTEGSYGDACRAGHEFAANFAQYLKDNPDEVGGNYLGTIIEKMYSSDGDTNGYRVGFLCYLEELIAIAAKRTNIFNNVDEYNMRSLVAEAELKEETLA